MLYFLLTLSTQCCYRWLSVVQHETEQRLIPYAFFITDFLLHSFFFSVLSPHIYLSTASTSSCLLLIVFLKSLFISHHSFPFQKYFSFFCLFPAGIRQPTLSAMGIKDLSDSVYTPSNFDLCSWVLSGVVRAAEIALRWLDHFLRARSLVTSGRERYVPMCTILPRGCSG